MGGRPVFCSLLSTGRRLKCLESEGSGENVLSWLYEVNGWETEKVLEGPREVTASWITKRKWCKLSKSSPKRCCVLHIIIKVLVFQTVFTFSHTKKTILIIKKSVLSFSISKIERTQRSARDFWNHTLRHKAVLLFAIGGWFPVPQRQKKVPDALAHVNVPNTHFRPFAETIQPVCK